MASETNVLDLKTILDMDKKIRYVAKISYEGEFLDYAYREDLDLEMDEKKQGSMGVHLSILADTHRLIDKLSGKVEITISLRPKIVSVIFYLKPILYCVSIDRLDNYSELIDKIQKKIVI